MEAVRTYETSVDNNFTRQYIPEDNSEHQRHILFILKSILILPLDYLTKIAHAFLIFPNARYISLGKKSKAVPLHAMEVLGGRGCIARIHSRTRH
jgi:hypothetical protein